MQTRCCSSWRYVISCIREQLEDIKKIWVQIWGSLHNSSYNAVEKETPEDKIDQGFNESQCYPKTYISKGNLGCYIQQTFRQVSTNESARTYPSFDQILCSNIDNSAPNSLCRVQTESVILIPLPWVQFSFCVDSSLIYCSRNRNIDQFTIHVGEKNQKILRAKQQSNFYH